MVNENFLANAKKQITEVLNRGVLEGNISTDYFSEMDPTDKKAGKYYQLFKVHKEHNAPDLPPGRPIISGCSSITKNISKFVDSEAKHLVKEIPSYIVGSRGASQLGGIF